MSKISETICYFSAEIGLSSSIPTYSGGLGVLAGDYIKASADLNLPVIGITLLYRHGQGIQRINRDGVQKERWNNFNPDGILKKEDAEIKLKLDGKEIIIEIWSKTVNGVRGHKGKVFFLDVNHDNLKSMQISDFLITDNSGIAIEYFAIFKRPVMYFDGSDILP